MAITFPDPQVENQITHNGVTIKLRPCQTEQEAHNIYKTEKQKYMTNV